MTRDPFDFSPNSYDGEGVEYWCPWEVIGIPGGYCGNLDREGLAVLKAIGDDTIHPDAKYVADSVGISINAAQLWQLLFVGADWCDYGMGPYACFPASDRFPELTAAWENYIEGRWGND